MNQVGNGEPAAAALDVRGRRGRGPYPRLGLALLHAVAATALPGAMLWMQRAYGLERYAETSLQWLRQSWLPVTGALLYALAWCGWYLMLTVRTRGDSKSNADIHREWKAAKRRLNRAGIDLHRVPLFLTLGQPNGGVHRFFSAGQFGFTVPAIPADDDAPLSVCGNRDAVFVCCNRTSLLGNFATQFAATAGPAAIAPAAASPAAATADPAPAVALGAEGPLATELGEPPEDCGRQAPGGTEAAFSSPHGSTYGSLSSGGGVMTAPLTQTRSTVAAVPLSETVRAMEQRLADLEHQLALADAASGAAVATAPAATLQATQQVESTAGQHVLERLELICRLVAEERDPFCPLNGIVLLVPIEATDSDATAEEVGERITQDLQAVMRNVEMEVSVQVVLCGLETCEGAEAWLQRSPDESRHQPLGTNLPDALETEAGAAAAWADRAADWLCDEWLPSLALGRLRRATADRSADRHHQEVNRSVHRFVRSMRERRGPLSRLLQHCAAPRPRHWRLRGCYLAATGDNKPSTQGFAAGLMPRILGMQHEVRWLDSRRSRDSLYLAITIAGYGIIALAAAATAAAMFAYG